MEFGTTAYSLWMHRIKIFARLLGFWRRGMFKLHKILRSSAHKTNSGKCLSNCAIPKSLLIKLSFAIQLNLGFYVA